MASTLAQSFKNLPANGTETLALKKLLDSDLELRSIILRKQEEAQAQCSYAKKAAEAFRDCLMATSAVKDAYAASMQSTKAFGEALKNALHLYDNHEEVLGTISSTKGILSTWSETVALTESMLAHLDKATTQLESHLYLAANEQVAHESAHIAASESLLSCTNSLRAMDQSVAQKRGSLFGFRHIPTDLLPRIFMEAVDARQHEIINSLSSYHDIGSGYYGSLSALLTTLNLVPFVLSATCKRWRVTCQSTPRLWRYARVPMTFSTYSEHRVIGKKQFKQCILLAKTQPLELTIYSCYNVTHRGATYSDLVLPEETQTLRVNIVWYNNYPIPPGIPSPTELCMVASANSKFPYIQTIPTELLANTKKLRCMELIPQVNHPVGVQSLYIVLDKSGGLPPFHDLLQNYPQLMELHLEINVSQSIPSTSAVTHQRLHHLSLTSIALSWVIHSFSAGCCLPHLVRLVLTDINGSFQGWDASQTNGHFSHITHVEIQAVSTPTVVAELRPLFEVTTALRTLTLAGSAVGPIMELMTLSVPKRIDELILCDSDANGTLLRDYLAAIERDGRGTSGMEVAWRNCPEFLGDYGRASGELHL